MSPRNTDIFIYFIHKNHYHLQDILTDNQSRQPDKTLTKTPDKKQYYFIN